jgi:hypothetical protein
MRFVCREQLRGTFLKIGLCRSPTLLVPLTDHDTPVSPQCWNRRVGKELITTETVSRFREHSMRRHQFMYLQRGRAFLANDRHIRVTQSAFGNLS